MTIAVILLLCIPACAGIASVWLPGRIAGLVSAASGIASFALVIALIPGASHRDLSWLGFARADALSVVFLLATSFLYACVAVYSIGYLNTATGHAGPAGRRYTRRFWAGLNLFAWSMLAAPVMGNLALLWVAIEVTTIVSALLVALEGTDGAAEAAWKYVLLASAGLAIALLGTIFAYYAGSRVLGPGYNLAFGPLLSVAGRLPHTAVMLAFVLAVLGFGTKVGLFPVHTWLPDAHSEAPTPVSALLSDLAILKSHSRPKVSNDNPYSEAQFKTLKYCPAFPGTFGSLQDARAFCGAFFTYYNHEHRHSGIGLHTPYSVHIGTAAAIQDQRQAVLNAACAANPRRFTRRPRAPKMPVTAWINKPVAEPDITQHPSREAA